jgi:hypothetical protein
MGNTTLRITTVSIKGLLTTLSITTICTQFHYDAEFCYAVCHHGECRYAECHFGPEIGWNVCHSQSLHP